MARSAISRLAGRARLLFLLAVAVGKCERGTFCLSGAVVASYFNFLSSWHLPGGLSPRGEDRSHNQVADKLVAGVDGEELHALFHEQDAGQLHGGDKSEPHMEPDHQADMEAFGPKPVQEKRQGGSGHQAGQKRTRVSEPGSLLRLL